MVVGEPNINNIMGGIENTGSVRLHNHRKKLKQRFDIIKKLGQGTYGKVQLGINKETGQEVAIKTIKKSKIETEADLVRIRREIQIMSSVQHPNIIHIYEVFENREKMVLVMEYAAGGELYDYLSERKVLAEEEARRIFRQIATACYYCHKHKICHRDLKLENILLDENGNAKIADFGLSNVFDEQRLLSTFCGSPLYASPEIVKGTPYQGPEVDCWSLGVLLYTLVYGAMPFDGSNFKRLVRQISQGDYFEPKKPSRASPLIRDMLTVNPRNRANIEKICAHWWVNEGYDDSCLEISEELANQTPVRLDLLLSLAPPPPQLESEKLVVTGETADETSLNPEGALPTRSQSVGSLMEFTNPAERRIKDLLMEEAKAAPKRKLEATVSTDQMHLMKDGVKRKDKIIKENTVADITRHGPIEENASLEDASMTEVAPIIKSLTQTISRKMDVEQTEEHAVDPSTQGAACAEIMEDAKKSEAAKKATNKSKEAKKEESTVVENNIDKENIKEKKAEEKEQKQQEPVSKIPAKRKSIKKKVLTDKNENSSSKTEQPAEKMEKKQTDSTNEQQQKAENEEAQPPNKPVERRRSRIFETAEKFQSMISANENKNAAPGDKQKKLVIPGVSVGGYKKEFERKASLTTPPKNSLSKKPSVDQEESVEEKPKEKKVEATSVKEESKPVNAQKDKTADQAPLENERQSQVKNAINVISNAIDKDDTKKSKSRPCMVRKPPVPFGSSGRSASGSIANVPSPTSPPVTPPQEPQPTAVHGSTPAQVVDQPKEETPEESKTSSAEITLKSATLPRRKTTKAEIKLDYPVPKPTTMGFKTEMAHHVEGPPKLPTQRSEVTFPVSSPTAVGGVRSASLEPETKAKQSPRERIIPISFEKDASADKKESVTSPPSKPPATKFQNQRSTISQRSNSLSRQSTQESDSETTTSTTGEPIRKSPREYIIPIAMEGGGYVTPRAGSLEPSDTASTTSTMTSKSKFSSRNRRLNDREGSEDESPFATLHRHSSFGRDSDTEDSRRDMFRMHSLRSSRPRKAAIEHNDSFSSGEDDDDDGFEILTAENLFSTLLSRVRDLTQRLNVDGRPGFPTSRLLSSHFDHGTNFWNMHNRADPLSRYAPIGRPSREQSVESTTSSRSVGSGAPWRRSVSRDLASDIESVFNSTVQPPTHTATLPRGDPSANRENLNLTDLDLKKLKLSDEDALALSYLTPGLSRRIQKQLLAQLAPSEAKKLTRTLSMRENKSPADESRADERRQRSNNRPVDDRPSTSTLPARRFSVESSPARYQQQPNEQQPNTRTASKSFLPVVKSLNAGLEGRKLRSPSIIVEPKSSYHLLPSPDSSTSDSLSNNKLEEVPSLSKFLSPARSFNTAVVDGDRSRTEIRRSPSGRRTSRFLRPDFYDGPKEGNYYLKEKKEREMETQKVLKEIRDKRKGKFRERSASRESRRCHLDADDRAANRSPSSTDEHRRYPEGGSCTDLTSSLLKNVSDNIKNLESNIKGIHHDYVNVSSTDDDLVPDYVNVRPRPDNNKLVPDYVNVAAEDDDYNKDHQEIVSVIKKDRPSRIARPKSYPTDGAPKIVPPDSKQKTAAAAKKSNEQQQQPSKNKFLQTIERKFEKLRSFSNSPTTSVSSEEARAREEKKSLVEDAIKRLREQSLPRNVDTCITESGLIKRAVSVEDLVNSDPKQLQASRKSVTKILNLFKKYEDKSGNGKKNEKTAKGKKAQKTGTKAKNSQLDNEKTDQVDSNKSVGAAVAAAATSEADNHNLEMRNDLNENGMRPETSRQEKKAERPRSLLLDRVKQFQYNGARSDSNILSAEKDLKMKGSKLPVTLCRRSLNLDNQLEPPKFYKNPNNSSENPKTTADRSDLKLNLRRHGTEPLSPGTSAPKENRNSLATTDSSVLSPCDDNDASCDSWSVCSDYQNQELTSPVSPSNHFYSADENESVSDRIRRKSFYSRFNEKKRPRKSTISNYRDLDLYKDMNNRKMSYKPVDFCPLDRKSADAGPSKKSSSYNASTPEPFKKDYKTYGRSNTTFSNDGYVNVPNRYGAYSPRAGRRSASVYGPDSEEVNTLDDTLAAGKNRMYSYHNQPSRYSSNNNRPISPMSEQLPLIDTVVPSSVSQCSTVHSSTSQDL